MAEAESLLTLAEIAVTLAGFSGLVGVFRTRSLDQWNPRDLLILWLILGLGGLAMVFALLPLPLFQAGLSAPVVWRATSLVFLVSLTAAIAAALIANDRLSRAGLPSRTPRVNRAATWMGILCASVLAANGLSLAHGWIYSSVLILLLALSFVFLAAFIFNMQFQEEAASS